MRCDGVDGRGRYTFIYTSSSAPLSQIPESSHDSIAYNVLPDPACGPVCSPPQHTDDKNTRTHAKDDLKSARRSRAHSAAGGNAARRPPEGPSTRRAVPSRAVPARDASHALCALRRRLRRLRERLLPSSAPSAQPSSHRAGCRCRRIACASHASTACARARTSMKGATRVQPPACMCACACDSRQPTARPCRPRVASARV